MATLPVKFAGLVLDLAQSKPFHYLGTVSFTVFFHHTLLNIVHCPSRIPLHSLVLRGHSYTAHVHVLSSALIRGSPT